LNIAKRPRSDKGEDGCFSLPHRFAFLLGTNVTLSSSDRRMFVLGSTAEVATIYHTLVPG
jgi:hypothetical protein